MRNERYCNLQYVSYQNYRIIKRVDLDGNGESD